MNFPSPRAEFDFHKWMAENVPGPKHSRALQILSDAETQGDMLIKAYNLGREVSEEAHRTEFVDLKATLSGLQDALECKNEITVVVNIKHGLWLVLTLLAIVAGALYLYSVYGL